MLRLISTVIVIILSYLLQVSVFSFFDMAGIIPNIMLITVVSCAVMRGSNEGMVIGFFSGLILDVFSGNVLGCYALIFVLLGFINGFFRPLIDPNNMLIPLFIILVNSFVYDFIIYTFTFLLRNKLDLPFYFRNVMLPETVYTFLVAIFLYNILMFINKRLEIFEKRSAI